MESHTIFLCQNYMGNGYKLSAQQFLGSFGWTIVSNYWLTVFKATIKWRLYTQMIPLIVAPKTCTHSPFSSWSRECDDRELTILRLRLGRYWIECNVIIGCLPFTKIFREIRFESKWNTTFWVSGPMENFREQRDIWKIYKIILFRVEYYKRKFVFHFFKAIFDTSLIQAFAAFFR